MTIHRKAVEQYFTVVLYGFPLYPVCNFGEFISFGLALLGVSGLISDLRFNKQLDHELKISMK